MKIKSLIITTVALTGLVACDSVNDTDRFLELPALEGAERVVLLEEFTGQLCVNCPEAHQTVKDLLSQYPENLISVSFHGGGDANSISADNKALNGLRTEQSEAYCADNNIPSFPAGVINRTSGVQTRLEWAATIREELKKESPMQMAMTAALAPDAKTVDITLDIDPRESLTANVQLWVVESGIVGFQLSKDGGVMDYVHDHVYRADVNGHGGEPHAFAVREPQTLTYQVAVSDDWNPARLSIVSFAYNAQGVLQAVHCYVEGTPQ